MEQMGRVSRVPIKAVTIGTNLHQHLSEEKYRSAFKMLFKVLLCSLFAAQAMGMEASKDDCVETPVGEGVVEEQCGDQLALKYNNGTAFGVQRVLFENENVWVLELNKDTDSCYVINKSDFPDGLDQEKLEMPVKADACQTEMVQTFVQACEGRIVYNLKEETEQQAVSRKKRATRRCVIILACRVICNRTTKKCHLICYRIRVCPKTG